MIVKYTTNRIVKYKMKFNQPIQCYEPDCGFVGIITEEGECDQCKDWTHRDEATEMFCLADICTYT